MIWDDIKDNLKSNGIDVYSPGTKQDECKAPYVVVKASGSSEYNGYSTDVNYYDVMCYVPQLKYSTLLPFVKQVEDVMKKIEPKVKPMNSKSPSFYDDKYKAHMISVSYRNFTKQ
jgi:hypothetical protein